MVRQGKVFWPVQFISYLDLPQVDLVVSEADRGDMDPIGRWIIGVFCFVGAAMCACIASGAMGAEPAPSLYIVASVCALIAIGCIGGKVGRAALRLVAASMFLFTGELLFSNLFGSDPKVKGAMNTLSFVAYFVFIGLPCGAFALGEKFFLRVMPIKAEEPVEVAFQRSIQKRKNGQGVTGLIHEVACETVASAQELVDGETLRRVSERTAMNRVLESLTQDQQTGEQLMSRSDAWEAVNILLEQIEDEDSDTVYFVSPKPKTNSSPVCFVASSSFATAVIKIQDGLLKQP